MNHNPAWQSTLPPITWQPIEPVSQSPPISSTAAAAAAHSVVSMLTLEQADKRAPSDTRANTETDERRTKDIGHRDASRGPPGPAGAARARGLARGARGSGCAELARVELSRRGKRIELATQTPNLMDGFCFLTCTQQQQRADIHEDQSKHSHNRDVQNLFVVVSKLANWRQVSPRPRLCTEPLSHRAMATAAAMNAVYQDIVGVSANNPRRVARCCAGRCAELRLSLAASL